MKREQYDEYIKTIKSGDLLAWSTNSKSSFLGKIITWVVRIFTVSEYCHVGIAYVKEDGLHVIEANPRYIRVTKLEDDEEFFHIPMDVAWTPPREAFMLSKVGLPYSYLDAVHAYFGQVSENDDTWQCAELADAFYHFCGMSFGDDQTPAGLVRNITEVTGKPITRVTLTT